MKAAVCLVLKNEVRNIAEWLAYQHVLGFDTVILLDNNSTDGTLDVVRRAAKVQDIRIHNWNRTNRHFHCDGYDAVCRLYAYEFDWIAFLDTDEFLVLHHGLGVHDWLHRYGPPINAVALSWAIYGSSGHKVNPDGLVIEAFVMRSLPDLDVNRHIKTVVRPWAAQGWPGPHGPHIEGRIVGPACDPLRWEDHGIIAQPPDWSVLQVNHYFCRSRQHWDERKSRTITGGRTEAEWTHHDRNDVCDPCASQHAAKVRQHMETFG